MHFKPIFKLVFATLFILVATIVAFPVGCKHIVGKCTGGESKSSNSGEDRSHNSGANCMHCHYSGGPAGICFTLGGTVFDSLQGNIQTGGTMKLYTGPNGTGDVVLTLHVDDRGNFYTSQTINFIGGLYPAITGSGGTTKYMSSPIKIGSCGSCHGVNTNKIWVP